MQDATFLQSAACHTAQESREAPLTKKLLEPRGCQESSEPTENSGPVMANSIAFEISL
jgi:hypothetical protein